MGALADLVHDYQHVIESITLVTGGAGVFDVVVDGDLLYSKQQTGRHANPREVLDLFRERYAGGVPVYDR